MRLLPLPCRFPACEWSRTLFFICRNIVILVPIFSALLTDRTFRSMKQNRIKDRQRESPEFSVDNVVIENIDVTAGNTLSSTLSFTLHVNNRYKSRGIYCAAAEAKLSFHYYRDGSGSASLIRPPRWRYYLDSGTLAYAAMSAAPVNLPPGNNVPTSIPFSPKSTNVTLPDDQASLLIEYKKNLDRFDAFLTVRALVKNGISDARSRLIEVNCWSMTLTPNSTHVFTCS
ncbi:unnamed protein product [Cuscuta europaea]|uniref:Uncharacterized protein n=1 Tax=Cuscuta europaea TaxID=41803 RepID=A0A9P0YYX2_CUSEU|nr:unnamed protein product [Cuscuta europaea]